MSNSRSLQNIPPIHEDLFDTTPLLWQHPTPTLFSEEAMPFLILSRSGMPAEIFKQRQVENWICFFFFFFSGHFLLNGHDVCGFFGERYLHLCFQLMCHVLGGWQHEQLRTTPANWQHALRCFQMLLWPRQIFKHLQLSDLLME